MKRTRAAALLLAMLAASAAQADALDQVMGALAARRHGAAQFIEQDFLAVLARPAESSGELHYDAPDRLEKITLAPHRESLVYSAGTVSVTREKTHRTLDLRSYPQLAPFLESIRATLAGDRAALEALFTLQFTGELARWSLTLVPRDAQVKRTVAQVQIQGHGEELSKVEIHQADGDRSVMTLRPVPMP